MHVTIVGMPGWENYIDHVKKTWLHDEKAKCGDREWWGAIYIEV